MNEKDEYLKEQLRTTGEDVLFERPRGLDGLTPRERIQLELMKAIITREEMTAGEAVKRSKIATDVLIHSWGCEGEKENIS